MASRIRQLFSNLAVYGMGDVLTSLVSVLLLPLYVQYLSATDYGIIGLLLTVEVAAKILFRWGVDGSFMRLYFDCPDHESKQRLASTIFFFLAVANGALLVIALLLAEPLARHLLDDGSQARLLRIVLVNTFVVGFYFIPFHELRIQEQSRRFIALTFSRSMATLIVRLLLVVGAGMGVLGIVLADILVTAVFTLVLLPRFASLIRPTFSTALLREALAFGLPRVPHGVAHQIVASADRYWLSLFVTVAEIGRYTIGATFGLGLKLFLSAFEYAWAPFYFAEMDKPDARQTFSRVTTYGVTILVFLTAGLSAIADDLVRLMTVHKPQFQGAAAFVPWVAIGVTLQGVYLLTSIGLNITKQTRYYPVSTGLAAATSVAANLILIPRVGAIGAAWANALAYVVLAGSAFWFSQRVYPMSYEWRRLTHAVVAGLVMYAVAAALPLPASALLGVLVRGAVVALGLPALLLVTGFLLPGEATVVVSLAARLRGTARA